MTKYILVEWPESQEYMERPGTFLCPDLNGAYFVPEDMVEE